MFLHEVLMYDNLLGLKSFRPMPMSKKNNEYREWVYYNSDYDNPSYMNLLSFFFLSLSLYAYNLRPSPFSLALSKIRLTTKRNYTISHSESLKAPVLPITL